MRRWKLVTGLAVAGAVVLLLATSSGSQADDARDRLARWIKVQATVLSITTEQSVGRANDTYRWAGVQYKVDGRYINSRVILFGDDSPQRLTIYVDPADPAGHTEDERLLRHSIEVGDLDRRLAPAYWAVGLGLLAAAVVVGLRPARLDPAAPAPAPPSARVVPSDPAFHHAGNESRVGTERWWGDVILGRDAIYIFQSQPARGRGLFELVEILADVCFPHQSLPGVPYDQIPAAVRTDPTWPVKNSPACPVLIIPRASVEFLHHQRGRLEVRLLYKGVEIAIPHGRFGANRLKTFLDGACWPLLWNGQPHNLPTADAAASRADAARTHPFRRPYRSAAMLTAGFLLGCLPMTLLLFPRLHGAVQSAVYLTGWCGGVALVLLGWIAARRGL